MRKPKLKTVLITIGGTFVALLILGAIVGPKKKTTSQRTAALTSDTTTTVVAVTTTTEAPSTTTTERPTTTEAPTTTTRPAPTATTAPAKPTHPDGQALIEAVKDQGGGNPMLIPLVSGEYKGGFLVVTYQEDDKDLASSVCNYIHNAAPPGYTLDDVAKIQMIGPNGNVLAMTDDAAGGNCRPGAHV